MDCNAVRDKLTLLTDDDLPAEEALAVRRHLAECGECAAISRDLDRLSQELRALPQPPVPADLRLRIGRALDAEAASKASPVAPGSSVLGTIAPYLAAAAVVALAFALASFVAQPRHRASRVAKTTAPLADAARAPSAPPPAEEGIDASAESEASEPAPSTSRDEAEAVRKAIATIEELQNKRKLRDADGELLRDLPPPATGNSEEGIVTIPPHEGVGAPGSGSKPPGTFASERGSGHPALPPAEPTVIDMRFLPPNDPSVGDTAQGMVEVSSREAIPEVVVTATGDAGLRIDKPGGVLYRGPLQAGEAVRVPVPMVASKSGSHEVNITVDSDAPGGDTELKVFVPSFKNAAAPRPESSPGDKPVSIVFKNTPIRQALMDIGKQAKLRIEIPQGLGAERISRDIRGVPAKAALQAVAESGGYTVTEAAGVYRISRKPDSQPD
jgi:hypothetical protein